VVPNTRGSDPPAGARRGRPRSERARQAVLEAVDDLLVDVGYAAMTMKGIAERAGVGRQTVYRWWSTKAEILLEACVADVREDLVIPPHPDPADDLLAYLKALTEFLTTEPAGLGYRALVGEAQHDLAVRDLVDRADPLTESARDVLDRVRDSVPGLPEPELCTAQLTGPVVTRILTRSTPLPEPLLAAHVASLLRAWGR
jgi:AcrR family transcriptional regulator